MHHWSGRTETATENRVGQAGSCDIAAAIRQWRRRWLQISDACLLAIFPTGCYQVDWNLANLEATVEVG